MSSGSGDIIVKGGSSVEVDYSDEFFSTRDGNKRKCPNRNIVRIRVVDDETGEIRYDSGNDAKGLRWTIYAYTQ